MARSEAVAASETAEASDLGLSVEQIRPQGTLVRGTEAQYAALEKRGYRVKLLADTNILEVGTYRIDIEGAPPRVPTELEVPAALKATWPHHLVQLAGARDDEAVSAIEARGVDVVEPISAYGLFVSGLPAQVEALKDLPFVAWVGPFKPAYRIAKNLEGAKGLLRQLSIGVYPSDALESLKTELGNSEIVSEERMPAPYGGEFGTLLADISATRLQELARQPFVRWLELRPPMSAFGERETQIVAENFNGAAAPATAPVTGYQAWLAGVGLSGSGVTVAICDTGVDANANNNANAHSDLLGRQAAFVDYTGGAAATDTNGHGTNVAGIAIGNAASGQTEAAAPANFLWGQGTAPQANYVTQNFLLANPQPTTTTLIQDASTNGAQVMNNSWGVDNSGGSGYTAASRTIDLAVRDPNTTAAGLENLILVCAAGNEGGRNSSISNPHESKNDIVVGNALTSRPGQFPSDDVRGISGTSSRGPAIDGRILPTVVAPGTDVSSAHSRTSARVPIPGTGVPDPLNPANTINQYNFMSGTSQATPHVSGTCALLFEWWRGRTGGRDPSTALVKALLINGAEDLAGGPNWRCLNRVTVDKNQWSLQSGSIFRRNMTFVPVALVEGQTTLTQVASLAAITAVGQWFFDAVTNRLFVRMLGNTNPANNVPFLHAQDAQPVAAIPNGHQGWGRISVPNMISQAPTSDRGPKIFSDQRHAFTANGQEHNIRVAPVDTARPLRITLVWTDAAGAANANPALVNDLDLEVTETATGNVYRGNVFANGSSVTGGAFDNRNNVECVYIRNPGGTYDVSVIAANITASARPDILTAWQDFALVIDNAEVPSAAPVSVVPVIDRSGSMVFSGYVDITRTSSKQFIDLMGVDDQLAVVSFGSNSSIDYSAAGPALQTITGQPIRDAARTAVDNLVFGGCTFMGAGINDAKSLLSPATNSKAIVLLSDGYDNKGCDQANPAKPSALDAVSTATMPVYTCAMGPASDQSLLDQIADVTNARYYYMPTIDDLFEIYNYIRGQVTGDAIVANESASASASRVAAFVDSAATEATFTVAWADAALRYTNRDPKKANEVAIRLRDPRGKLVHPDSSYVRRTVGQGYVVFEIQEPAPGRWFVEVSTARETHLRYTVGGFVRSPIRLLVTLRPHRFRLGGPIHIAAQAFDGKNPLPDFKAKVQITAPVLGIPGLMRKYGDKLKRVEPPKFPGGDSVPADIGRLLALRAQLLKAKQPDPFAHNAVSVGMRGTTLDDLRRLRLRQLISPLPPVTFPATTVPGVLTASFKGAQQQGSYNVAVTVDGASRLSRTRFVRKDMISALVT